MEALENSEYDSISENAYWDGDVAYPRRFFEVEASVLENKIEREPIRVVHRPIEVNTPLMEIKPVEKESIGYQVLLAFGACGILGIGVGLVELLKDYF